jgi:hypothetical protein
MDSSESSRELELSDLSSPAGSSSSAEQSPQPLLPSRLRSPLNVRRRVRLRTAGKRARGAQQAEAFRAQGLPLLPERAVCRLMAGSEFLLMVCQYAAVPPDPEGKERPGAGVVLRRRIGAGPRKQKAVRKPVVIIMGAAVLIMGPVAMMTCKMRGQQGLLHNLFGWRNLRKKWRRLRHSAIGQRERKESIGLTLKDDRLLRRNCSDKRPFLEMKSRGAAVKDVKVSVLCDAKSAQGAAQYARSVTNGFTPMLISITAPYSKQRAFGPRSAPRKLSLMAG